VIEYKHRQINLLVSCWHRIHGNYELFERRTAEISVIEGISTIVI